MGDRSIPWKSEFGNMSATARGQPLATHDEHRQGATKVRLYKFEMDSNMLTFYAPLSSSSPQIQDLATAFENVMDRGKEEIALAQVTGEVMLQVLTHLLILIVGEQIFAGMVCMIPQATFDNVLPYALGKTACLVVPSDG